MLEYPPKGYLHTEEQLVGLVGNMPMSAFLVGTVGGRGGVGAAVAAAAADGNSVVAMMRRRMLILLLFQTDPDCLDHYCIVRIHGKLLIRWTVVRMVWTFDFLVREEKEHIFSPASLAL